MLMFNTLKTRVWHVEILSHRSRVSPRRMLQPHTPLATYHVFRHGELLINRGCHLRKVRIFLYTIPDLIPLDTSLGTRREHDVK